MNNKEFKFRTTKDVTKNDIDEIYNKLYEFNLAHREAGTNEPIGVFYEDEKGVKLAGLTGETYGNWLCIKYLWVNEKIREQGIGSSILKTAEKEAIQRGCKYSFVDTFNFQAPEFYKRYGYKEVFELKQYPITGSRYYYTKTL